MLTWRRNLAFQSGLCVVVHLLAIQFSAETCWGLERVRFNHPGLHVDLGVGLWAWPMPIDWDRDGDLDLVVSCPDIPSNGTYFFENRDGNVKYPVFRPAVRIGNGMQSVQVSYVDGIPHILTPATEWLDFWGKRIEASRTIYPTPNIHTAGHKIRANQWRYVDYNGDSAMDLVVGVEDWHDYGWDNAFDNQGTWTRGPLHGVIYWIRNRGSTDAPNYDSPVIVEAEGKAVDPFGMPSPNFADFDGDGDLDLLCGEFLDGFTYFQNIGTSREPSYMARGRLRHQGEPIAMQLQMITPTAIDWDRDGDQDLVVGDEDGRVALVEHTGQVENGIPQFLPPRYFQQEAADLKFGALVTPFNVDWDHDGDDDLVCGNTAGQIGLLENLDGGNPPRWGAPRLFGSEGKPIRIQAGAQGSIQGPAEAKWGYTTLHVADWDGDGNLDLVVNSIWGQVVWFRGRGIDISAMSAAQPVRVDWHGPAPKPAWNWWTPKSGTLATQWRTTPAVIDFNQDQQLDLVMLDHEGFLAAFRRIPQEDSIVLAPGERLFVGTDEKPLRMNDGIAGKSGRRKFCFVDWDGDGHLDIIANSENVHWLRQVPDAPRSWTFEDRGTLSDHRLAGHSTSPTTVDWDRNGRPDILIGAEDGHFYYLPNPDPKP